MSIRFESVGFEYAPGQPVFQKLSFELAPGECLLVVGHNGSGKSTLLKLLNGVLRPSTGRVVVAGRETSKTATSELARDVCVTFQNPADQIFAATVAEEIRFGPRSLNRKDPESLARAALELCGLTGFATRHPYDLSQPARKLLTVASAIATGTRTLAFDEPSVSLSEPERHTLRGVVSRLRREGRALIIVSHDLGLFLPFADRLLVLRNSSPPALLSFADVLSHEHLLRASGVRLPYAERLERFLRRAIPGISPTHPRATGR